MGLLLLKVHFFMHVLAAIWVLCALILILVILIQKGRGTGLSGAFGGGMASGILGTKTGDFLTWVTITLVGLFLLLSVVLAKFYRPMRPAAAGEPPAQTQPVGQQPAQQPPTQQPQGPPPGMDMPQQTQPQTDMQLPDVTGLADTNQN